MAPEKQPYLTSLGVNICCGLGQAGGETLTGGDGGADQLQQAQAFYEQAGKRRMLFPNSRDPPTAMLDEKGNLVTSVDEV